jgi:hypothetical protein
VYNLVLVCMAGLDISTKKKMKNVPVLYDELKTKRTVNLTDTAWSLLKDRATQKGISISEHIEIWARSEGIDNQRSGDRD